MVSVAGDRVVEFGSNDNDGGGKLITDEWMAIL